MDKLNRRPRRRRLFWVVTAIIVIAIVAMSRSRPEISALPGFHGPLIDSHIPPPSTPSITDFGGGGSRRLAVLVTDPSSDWTGLARVLTSRGIPFTMTQNIAEASAHKALIVYPGISGRLLPSKAIRALATYVHGGGGLLTFDLAGGGLEGLFGISGEQPGRQRNAVRWLSTGNGTEFQTPLNASGMEVRVGSQAFSPTSAAVLARFDDGSPAATCNRSNGRACLIGVDVGAYANRALNLRAEPLAHHYVNALEDGLDRLVDQLRDFYLANEPDAYIVGTAPAPFAASLVLTHDLDARQAVGNALVYARALRARGVDATFFMQTKYVRDWNDDIFFEQAMLPKLRELRALGMEIGSHGVSHARAFRGFDLGTGTEAYPDYRPIVTGQTTARGGTVLGELRVSKYLLDTALGTSIHSFRPGHLENPATLPQALAATNYEFTSDLTSDNVLSNYPYKLAYGRAGPALVPVWNFPVAIEDEKMPSFAARNDQSRALIEKISARQGTTVMLIHPDQGAKLGAELQLVDAFKGRLWIGSLGRLGAWWRARSLATFDIERNSLVVKAREPLSAVRIYWPHTRRFIDVSQPAGARAYPLP